MDSGEKFMLGEAACLLRCQASRERLEGFEELAMGLLPDGRFVCHEALARDVDARTGVLRVEPDNIVEVDMGRHLLKTGERVWKFFLRVNDLVFTFGGTDATLCAVGLVTEEIPDFVIPGRALCIIRPESIDPVWLFYYLRRNRGRLVAELAPEPAGGRKKTQFLSLETVRKLEIRQPSDREIEGVNIAHKEIMAETAKIREALSKVDEEQKRINSILTLSGR